MEGSRDGNRIGSCRILKYSQLLVSDSSVLYTGWTAHCFDRFRGAVGGVWSGMGAGRRSSYCSGSLKQKVGTSLFPLTCRNHCTVSIVSWAGSSRSSEWDTAVFGESLAVLFRFSSRPIDPETSEKDFKSTCQTTGKLLYKVRSSMWSGSQYRSRRRPTRYSTSRRLFLRFSSSPVPVQPSVVAYTARQYLSVIDSIAFVSFGVASRKCERKVRKTA